MVSWLSLLAACKAVITTQILSLCDNEVKKKQRSVNLANFYMVKLKLIFNF